ncbi:MAG: hypothetical protein M3245_06195 [Actinomycetota bacterium]|nr:hypothetical protein [Actinomycetota bacterium]
MQKLRDFLKRALPGGMVQRIRRRLMVRRYLRALSIELLTRAQTLRGIDMDEAVHKDGFYQLVVKDVLERTDLVLQALDRRIEAQGARHVERIRALEAEVAALRAELDAVRSRAGVVSPAQP